MDGCSTFVRANKLLYIGSDPKSQLIIILFSCISTLKGRDRTSRKSHRKRSPGRASKVVAKNNVSVSPSDMSVTRTEDQL